MRLEGKTAIVTGGASGFGAGIVQKFLSEGARVMIADINGDAARHMAATLGPLADHCQADVSDGDSVQAMADAALNASIYFPAILLAGAIAAPPPREA